MQPLSSFNENLGTAIALVGGAGAGKTSLGMRLFPRTYVGFADLNFASGKRYLEQIGQLDNVVGADNYMVDESGKPVPANLRYNRMLTTLDAAIKDPRIETIFQDSGTFIEDIIKAKICGAATDAAIKLGGFEQWGNLVITWKSLITQLRQSGKKYILSFHEKKELDASDQIFKYKIAVDGSISDKIPAYFSDVWRCWVKEPQQIGGKHEWMLTTLPNIRQEHLKNTFSLPGTISQDEAIKKVREATK